ncbi:hypothetical protein [Maribacter litoralis]|uniref:hypothetical protein n=1 Tax=Maribacter litoralis TaxID=2059726 RepID=UPI003F5CD28C
MFYKNEDYNTNFILYYFFLWLTKEFEVGQIICRNGNTINVKIKVLNRCKSLDNLRYWTKPDKKEYHWKALKAIVMATNSS